MTSDVLRVTGASVECLIGIHPEERATPQPLLIDMAFALDTRRAAQEENLALSIDYARVTGEVAFVLQMGEFHLLETAAEVVSRAVLSGLDGIDEMELTLKKPKALAGNGVPSLTITRSREAASSMWTFSFGVVDVVWNVRGTGVYRLRLRPGASVQWPRSITTFAREDGRQGEQKKEKRLQNSTAETRSYLLWAKPPLRLDEFVAG